MIENPWSNILRPDDSRSFTCRRADPDHRYGFFWGKDVWGRILFLMVFKSETRAINQRLPILKGIEVVEQILAEEKKSQLVLALKEQSNSDLFYRLCCDLIDVSRSCPDERTAVAITLSRLWRWHRLMQHGGTDKLSDSEQKGLIGELSFLKDTLFAHFPPAEAVSFWQGSILGEGEKDFSIGETAIEIKTRSGSAPSKVRISSEGQLDAGAYRHLFLVVFEVSSASSDQDYSFNLNELVTQIRVFLSEKEPSALQMFEERIGSYGYSDLHDYKDDRFVMLGSRVFNIEDTFPRLVPSDVPAGINDVTYTLDLSACSVFEVNNNFLLGILGESK